MEVEKTADPSEQMRYTVNVRRGMNLVFALLLLVLLVNRINVLRTANLYIDSDQPFMWTGTRDYAEGNFHEPRFYGQDYNTFLEALVAAPFYKAGVPVYIAVPLATHLLFLFPVLFTVLTLYFRGYHAAAILALCVFDSLTMGFDIMSGLPRGFITGLPFLSFFILSYLHPTSIRYIFLNAVMLVTGLFINPNIILAGAPLFAYLCYHNYRNKWFWMAGGTAAVMLVPLYLLFDLFYDRHPEYVIYGLVNSFSIRYLLENINGLDKSFCHISFFFEDNCWPLLLVLAGCLLTPLISGRRDVTLAVVVFLLMLLFSMMAGKTREGSTWPFYSYSRMYLAVPFFIAILPALLRIESLTIVATAATMSLTFSAYKISRAQTLAAYHTNVLHAAGVNLIPLPNILDAAAVYRKLALDNKCDHILISNHFFLSPYLSYGGPALYKDFPTTEESQSDRRYWVWQYNHDKVYRRFLLIADNRHLEDVFTAPLPFTLHSLDGWGSYLVENNQLPNGEFIRRLKQAED